MAATVILGLMIALAFGYGLKKIYRSFFKAEPACCNGGSGCTCCSGCGEHSPVKVSEVVKHSS